MLTRQQKENLVAEFKKDLAATKTVVICDYKGLTVQEMTELRRNLKQEGIKAQVLKKTIAQKAMDEEGVEIDIRSLEGQLIFVSGGEDEITAAKLLNKFSKSNDSLKMVAGVLEGKAMNQEEVVALAKLPTKEELIAKVVGSLKAPLSGLVNVLNGNLRSLVYVLQAIKDKKEEQGV